MNDNVTLKVNGKEIPMNPFVKRTFSNVLTGLVGSLDKLPEPVETIEITLKKEEK